MDESSKILLLHAERYPLMQPEDALKLLFQAEFGGAHILSRPELALPRIEAEFRALGPAPEPFYPVEPIGKGLVRVSLYGLNDSELPFFAELFVHSAASVKASEKSFWASAEALTHLCEEGRMPFFLDELQALLSAYRAEGLHPISHSERYRSCYHPAYRVMLASDAARLRP